MDARSSCESVVVVNRDSEQSGRASDVQSRERGGRLFARIIVSPSRLGERREARAHVRLADITQSTTKGSPSLARDEQSAPLFSRSLPRCLSLPNSPTARPRRRSTRTPTEAATATQVLQRSRPPPLSLSLSLSPSASRARIPSAAAAAAAESDPRDCAAEQWRVGLRDGRRRETQ